MRRAGTSIVSYQGRVLNGGSPVNGSGFFKFALVNAAGTTTFWSNDGTSAAGNEPSAGVPLSVSNGSFTVLLGDTSVSGMSVLRVSDGFHVMTPTVGRGPAGIVYDGANMWVTNNPDNRVNVLRARDGFRVMTPTVGSGPKGIAIDGTNMWVVNNGVNSVSKR